MYKPAQRIMMISTHGYVAAEPELGRPDTGGQVVYVLELSRCLAHLGYEVDILTRQFENQPSEEEVDERVRVLRFPCGGKGFIPKETLCNSIPEWVQRVGKFIVASPDEYAFINSHYWDAGLAGQALANRFRIPHFHTPHSIGSWKRDNMDGNPAELESKYNFRRRIREEKVVYDECDLLIATTPAQRDILLSPAGEYNVPSHKVKVIPPGYDDRRFFPVSRASRKALQEQFAFDGRVVLALGRIAQQRVRPVNSPMVEVCERVPDAKLVLAIGSTSITPREEEMVDEYKQLAAELGIADHVEFRDYIPDEQLADCYRAADLFALSSRYEPFGMTAVEAMACGTPTIVTTEGGLWEQVTWGREAVFANPFDPAAFGHAISFVLQYNAIYDRLAKFGCQKARAHFTWTGIAQQLINLVDSIPHSSLEHAWSSPLEEESLVGD